MIGCPTQGSDPRKGKEPLLKANTFAKRKENKEKKKNPDERQKTACVRKSLWGFS
jgi:hypothetical protein